MVHKALNLTRGVFVVSVVSRSCVERGVSGRVGRFVTAWMLPRCCHEEGRVTAFEPAARTIVGTVERRSAAVWKTVVGRLVHRGFESHPSAKNRGFSPARRKFLSLWSVGEACSGRSTAASGCLLGLALVPLAVPLRQSSLAPLRHVLLLVASRSLGRQVVDSVNPPAPDSARTEPRP